MNLIDIKNQVQMRLEDKTSSIYSATDLIRAIDTAVQKIPALLDKQYLSRLLHEQKINITTYDTVSETALYEQDAYLTDYGSAMSPGTAVSGVSYNWNGYIDLNQLTSDVITGQTGHELMYDQIESAFLIPNSIVGVGADITESIVWIHITDQLGRYELENSYMYTPAGDSPVFVRTGVTNSNVNEVRYNMLPTNLPKFGEIHLMYYKKPKSITSLNTDEPELASISHEAIVYFACSELLSADGSATRAGEHYSKANDIIGNLNSKVANMDVTKKQSQI